MSHSIIILMLVQLTLDLHVIESLATSRLPPGHAVFLLLVCRESVTDPSILLGEAFVSSCVSWRMSCILLLFSRFLTSAFMLISLCVRSFLQLHAASLFAIASEVATSPLCLLIVVLLASLQDI